MEEPERKQLNTQNGPRSREEAKDSACSATKSGALDKVKGVVGLGGGRTHGDVGLPIEMYDHRDKPPRHKLCREDSCVTGADVVWDLETGAAYCPICGQPLVEVD